VINSCVEASIKMLIKKESESVKEACLNYQDSEVCNEDTDEEGELKIDLDYNDYLTVAIKEEDEPLDLSVKTTSDILCDLKTPILPKLVIRPDLFFSEIDKRKELQVISNASKGSVFTGAEIAKLLDSYVKSVDRKSSCTVCDIKFAQKGKALTHVENKHVDCLQYKCPLCRASKGTRLAYESHLRRAHGEKAKNNNIVIKCKRKFNVKSNEKDSKPETPVGQPYDFEFVTFL
jgi:hypothetical protein